MKEFFKGLAQGRWVEKTSDFVSLTPLILYSSVIVTEFNMWIPHLSCFLTVIFWLWFRSCYPGEALLICCAMTRSTFPGLKTSSWTLSSSVYSKRLLLMGSVHSSASLGRTKPLAQIEVSERWSQRSSRRWLSLAADWTKLFHLVTVHVNGKTQTQWHIQNPPLVVLYHSRVACIVFNLHSCTICCHWRWVCFQASTMASYLYIPVQKFPE